ncbi:MAG: UTP-glucose-1-phosphate uridylyltransferase [Candidatus Pacebacteria bacterium GW2011_GWA1_46_10]|nr:MAG: UTP-glucose-1-phosphate uridylyltransferase [Candidatus Pacebacteria bacterium GW2011_GWA1_46_10]
MKIRKAVIALAGFGTRFLPVTKTIQKEMIPVINRPVVDYLVDDLVKAGIQEIILVVNEHSGQAIHYYQENHRLEKYLQQLKKAEAYSQIKDIPNKATFHFVKQRDQDPYGTAVPVKLAKEYLKDEEAFVVLMGDDIPYNADGSSEVANMIQYLEQTGADSLATFSEQPTEQLYVYGVADTIEKNSVKYLKKLVEKPAPGTAPSNLANISKYILTPAVFDIIDQQQPNPQSGEFYITDTVTTLAQTNNVVVYTPKGVYLDCGYPLGWLKANLVMAQDNPALKEELQTFLKTLGL